MVTENSMELENQAFLSNQDITGEAPKLLLCSKRTPFRCKCSYNNPNTEIFYSGISL